MILCVNTIVVCMKPVSIPGKYIKPPFRAPCEKIGWWKLSKNIYFSARSLGLSLQLNSSKVASFSKYLLSPSVCHSPTLS